MDLNQLREKGGFVSLTPVSQEVSWTRPSPEGEDVTDTFTVRIKKFSAGAIERLWADSGKAKDQSSSAYLISKAVFLGDEGEQMLGYDDAFQLDPTLAEALIETIDKVNPLKRRKGKND